MAKSPATKTVKPKIGRPTEAERLAAGKPPAKDTKVAKAKAAKTATKAVAKKAVKPAVKPAKKVAVKAKKV